MKKAPYILFLVLLLSCQKEKKNPFIGSWYFDQVVSSDTAKSKYPKYLLENHFSSKYNFEIINDSILDYKEGFYHYILNKYKDENDYQKSSPPFRAIQKNALMLGVCRKFRDALKKVSETLEIFPLPHPGRGMIF